MPGSRPNNLPINSVPRSLILKHSQIGLSRTTSVSTASLAAEWPSSLAAPLDMFKKRSIARFIRMLWTEPGTMPMPRTRKFPQPSHPWSPESAPSTIFKSHPQFASWELRRGSRTAVHGSQISPFRVCSAYITTWPLATSRKSTTPHRYIRAVSTERGKASQLSGEATSLFPMSRSSGLPLACRQTIRRLFSTVRIPATCSDPRKAKPTWTWNGPERSRPRRPSSLLSLKHQYDGWSGLVSAVHRRQQSRACSQHELRPVRGPTRPSRKHVLQQSVGAGRRGRDHCDCRQWRLWRRRLRQS
jgi:hypothetical protein